MSPTAVTVTVNFLVVLSKTSQEGHDIRTAFFVHECAYV